MRHSEETHWRKSEAKKKQRNTQETIIFVKWRNQQICRSCWRKNWAQTTLDAKAASHYNLQVKGCENVDLTGFKAFDFSEGVPYFSVTKNGLTFSKAVTLKLGCPSYVRLLINPDTKQVVLKTPLARFRSIRRRATISSLSGGTLGISSPLLSACWERHLRITGSALKVHLSMSR